MRGSLRSSRSSPSVPAWTPQTISVPPDTSRTQAVSSRRASACATATAASGAHTSRTAHDVRPSRAPSSRPTTRTTPAARSLR
ncbi:hypothetical protein MF672_017495 [Actinomadura sp. ATCC 31491]|uniref:Uncharacterized protein n=1 Tax=Actinomadura luzonensis TaxID=2805427 RepID=A0ABT0FTA3_9ACTN|nr:hypothetical protein [Actinomadura luzonensis]MCK2215567.1 hypothetical protein [Actinomadura luzonensis]